MTRPHLRHARRRVLLTLALVSAAVAPGLPAHAGPHDPRTPVEHFVFLLQANHTFDNYFGTRPGVDGLPHGTCMPVARDQPRPCVKPYWIGEAPVLDLDQTAAQFRRSYNGGLMNGFVEANSDNDRDGSIVMGYYDDRDLPYYWNIADEYVLFDRFFSSAKGGSVANHMYAVTGAPGIKGDDEGIPAEGWGELPTIFDRLDEAGLDWKFYIENYDPSITYRNRGSADEVDRAAQIVRAPLLAYARYIDDPELNKHIVDLDEYYRDVQDGSLPAVSYIAASGASEHPPARIQAGEELVRTLVNELMRSELWESSAFLWSYDDWGGWYDHVRPPQVDRYGYGFRVPALLVSPFARRGFVDHTTNDFTSVLAFIEWNWGLSPLARRDRAANNLLEAFDFTSPRPPAFLGTARTASEPERVDSRPVYVAYGGGVLVLLLLSLLARERVRRRGIHPRALSSADLVEGRELP